MGADNHVITSRRCNCSLLIRVKSLPSDFNIVPQQSLERWMLLDQARCHMLWNFDQCYHSMADSRYQDRQDIPFATPGYSFTGHPLHCFTNALSWLGKCYMRASREHIMSQSLPDGGRRGSSLATAPHHVTKSRCARSWSDESQTAASASLSPHRRAARKL
jgi:hypothetical protein